MYILFLKRGYTLGTHCILLKQFILQKYIYLIILLSTLNFLRLTIYDYIILNARSYSPSPPICKGGGRGVLVGTVLYPHQCEGRRYFGYLLEFVPKRLPNLPKGLNQATKC
jgi:hypothetical protein